MSLNLESLNIEIKDRYALLGINRPKALNALNHSLLLELRTAIAYLEEESKNKDLAAVLLYGLGDRAFVAGADIATMQKNTFEANMEFLKLGQDCFNELSRANFISISVVNGFALGGGVELALATDIRLSSESGVFALPEVSLGLIPGFGGTQRLPRIVGKGLALELILSGARIDAKRAYEIGLINHILPSGNSQENSDKNYLEHAQEFTKKMLAKNSKSAQLMAKRAIHLGLEMTLIEGQRYEMECNAKLFSGPDTQEGLNAFVEKRPANFS